jgi:hypothetical protein
MDARSQLRQAGARLWAVRGGLVAFLLLGGLLYWIISGILSLEKEIAAVIFAGVLTVFGSVSSLIFARIHDRKREVEKEIRNKKIPIYERFVQFLVTKLFYQMTKNGTTKKDNSDIVDFLRKFHTSALIWGSDDVLRQWISFLRVIKRLEKENQATSNIIVNAIIPTGELLLALRKDIGHDNKNLSSLGIMHLFIHDLSEEIDKVLAAASPPVDPDKQGQ